MLDPLQLHATNHHESYIRQLLLAVEMNGIDYPMLAESQSKLTTIETWGETKQQDIHFTLPTHTSSCVRASTTLRQSDYPYHGAPPSC